VIESDEELYARLLRGELAAFDRLYARFERPLFGFVLAQLGDRAEAEDVLHETFVAVLQARHTRAELRSVKAWLFQVARNLCLNRMRARKRTSRALEAAAELAQIAPPAEPEVDPKALHEAVGRLPPALAEVYQLRASGLSYDDVAVILEIPLGTVKSRVHEMVKRLREEMA
jgi:RNA polymerase sigma-70 factor (ECF subfamily)